MGASWTLPSDMVRTSKSTRTRRRLVCARSSDWSESSSRRLPRERTMLMLKRSGCTWKTSKYSDTAAVSPTNMRSGGCGTFASVTTPANMGDRTRGSPSRGSGSKPVAKAIYR